MPYNAFPTTQADALKQSFVAKTAQVKANKNPLKAAALNKELDTIGKQLKAKLDADIAGIRAQAIQHFQKVDGWLGDASKSLQGAKTAHAAYVDQGQKKDGDIAMGAAATIEGLKTTAQGDADQFGQSWFQYRGWNPGLDPKLGAKYADKFKEEVGKLMAESKNFLVKIGRIDTLHKEALAIKKLASSKVNDPGIIDKQGAAAEMTQTLQGMVTTMFNASKDANNAMGNMDSLRDNANDPARAKTTPLKSVEQVFANLTNLIKGYMQSVSAMQKVYDTECQQFKGEDRNDPEIKAEMAKSLKILTETKYKAQVLESGYKTAVKDMEKVRKNYAKKK